MNRPRPAVRGAIGLRRAIPLLAAAGGALVLAGCGSSSSPSSSSSAPAPAPVASNSSSAGTVTATETDFHIALSTTTFHPGPVTFQAQNSGKFPHALTVDGPGVSDQATSKLSPGQHGSVTVTLQAGTYTVYCPVDGHRAKGMLTHITVGGGAAPSTSPATTSGSSSGGAY